MYKCVWLGVCTLFSISLIYGSIEYFLFLDIQETGRTTLSTKMHQSTDCKTYNVIKAKTNTSKELKTTVFWLCFLFIIVTGTDVKTNCQL